MNEPGTAGTLLGLAAAGLLLVGCGTADKRLLAHTDAEPAPPLVATENVAVPSPTERYALPTGVTPRALELATLKELAHPPELETAESESRVAKRAAGTQAELVEGDPPFLRLTGDRERVWGRIESALTAGGFMVRERRSEDDSLRVRYAEAGGDAAGTEGIIYRLELERGDDSHRLWLRDAEGGPVPPETANRVLTIIRDRL